MLHYMLYKALSDERTRDAVAAARRHQLIAAATQDSRDTTERASRLKDVPRRLVALLSVPRRTRSTVTSTHGGGSTMTSTSGAGPIGCAT